MARITMRVKLNESNRLGDFIRTRCGCGLIQYITDQDAAIPGVFECQCGAPFAIADIYGNVYRITERIRRGVTRHAEGLG